VTSGKIKSHYHVPQEPKDHTVGEDYMDVDDADIIGLDYVKRIADNLALLTEKIAQLQLEIDMGKAPARPQKQNTKLDDDIFGPDAGEGRRTRNRRSGETNEMKVRVSSRDISRSDNRYDAEDAA
jgi:hypothetical protein